MLSVAWFPWRGHSSRTLVASSERDIATGRGSRSHLLHGSDGSTSRASSEPRRGTQEGQAARNGSEGGVWWRRGDLDLESRRRRASL